MRRGFIAVTIMAACLGGCTPSLSRRGGECLTQKPADFDLGPTTRLVTAAPGVTIRSASSPELDRIIMSCGKTWCAGQGAHEIMIRRPGGRVDAYYVPGSDYYGGVSRAAPYRCRMVNINRGGDLKPTGDDVFDTLFPDP